MIRYHRPGGTKAALRAMRQDRERVRQELRSAVAALFGSLPDLQPVLPEKLERRIAALAEFAVIARTHIPRDGRTREVIYMPEPEASTRLAQQLSQLAKGSALLGGRETVNKEDLNLVGRAGFDSIPAMRRLFVNAMLTGGGTSALDLDLPDSTWRNLAQDLKMLGLTAQGWDGSRGRGVQLLSDKARRLLRQAGIRHKGGQIGRRNLVGLTLCSQSRREVLRAERRR